MLLLLLLPSILAANFTNGLPVLPGQPGSTGATNGSTLNNNRTTPTSLPSLPTTSPKITPTVLPSLAPSRSAAQTTLPSGSDLPSATALPSVTTLPSATALPSGRDQPMPTLPSGSDLPSVTTNPTPYEESPTMSSTTYTSVSFSFSASPMVGFLSQTQVPNSTASQIPVPNNSQVSIYDSYQFKVGTIVGAVVIIMVIVYANGFSLRPKPPQIALPAKPLQNVVNPLKKVNPSITENGITYYYDGDTGKLLAAGWQRYQDGGDVWYTNSNGLAPSWAPVYK